MDYRELYYSYHFETKITCPGCNQTFDRNQVHIDHILPKSKFPQLQNSLWNLQALCEICNTSKKDKIDNDTIKYLILQLEKYGLME